MTDYRINSHPILHDNSLPTLTFYWNDQPFLAKPGEMIASALYAHGIRIFGHHPKDNAPQGIFCANGQCAQCMVIADGLPVKACMTAVRSDMRIKPADGLPVLPEVPMQAYADLPITEYSFEVLIIGGGPAGLSAAKELGKQGVNVLLIDDKSKLGGKLVLQTHRFFGSKEAVFAGTRGIDIAKKLEEQVRALPSVTVWLSSTAIGIFEDHSVGVLREGSEYVLVHPQVLLVATGAREKSLAFPGNTLPGVYGAGAFQTLVNRDLVKPCQNLFIVGGGNVGLIAGYHAIQAGIHVAGLVEAAPQCGGYKVHQDKLARSGVPIYTSHTVLEAIGTDHVEKVVIVQVDEHFQPIPRAPKNSSPAIPCSSRLGWTVNEFTRKAQKWGYRSMPLEMLMRLQKLPLPFSGKIVGTQIAERLGKPIESIPKNGTASKISSNPNLAKLSQRCLILKPRGFPVLHCTQEIPCDPCVYCPRNLIHVNLDDIRSLPRFLQDEQKGCTGCLRCVAVCPGLAITLVEFRKSQELAQVSLPYELQPDNLKIGDLVEVSDTDGETLGCFPVVKVRQLPSFSGTTIVTVEVPTELATQVAGLRLIAQSEPEPFYQVGEFSEHLDDEAYICRCERVKVGEIRSLIRTGVRDINQIKALTRASMGSCGGKTCLSLIKRLYQAEGIPLSEVTEPPVRPVFVEVPFRPS